MTDAAITDGYGFRVRYSPEDHAYVATTPEFAHLSGLGPTPDSALREVLEALDLAIEAYRAKGWPLPEPMLVSPYSGQFRVRLPKDLHARLAERALDQGVSLNTLVVALLAEGVMRHSRRTTP